ncbi:MAG TPA: hypothetical protein VMD31_12815 [Opitutaceae bacterium]|nr:hypothetical protein [Opitutaceae bacterium]
MEEFCRANTKSAGAAAAPVCKWSRETGAGDLTADAVHNDEARQTLSWNLSVVNDPTAPSMTRAVFAAQTAGLARAGVSAMQAFGPAVSAAASDQFNSGAFTLKMQEELPRNSSTRWR